MADAPITAASAGLGAAGANILLRFLSDEFVAAGRNVGSPLKFISNVGMKVQTIGEKVGVPVAPTISSALLTDGQAKVLDDTVAASVDVTLNKHRYAAFGLTQVAAALAGDLAQRVMIQSRVAGLLNDIEADVLSVITAGVTTNTSGTYNTAITEAAVKSAIVKLDDYKTPAPLIGLVRHDANAWGALSSLAGFDQWAYTGQESPNVQQSNGQGRLWRGVNWFKTQAMPKATNDIDNLIFNPQAVAMAMRPMQSPVGGPLSEIVYDEQSGIVFQLIIQWNPSTMSNEVVAHALYGYSVVKQTWACNLKS